MSYRIDPTEPVEVELRRIAREQLAKAIHEIDGDDLDVHATVHKVRVRCKKIRALARLVRKRFDAYDEANRSLRDAGRRLAELRDAQSDLETLERLADDRGDVLEEGALAPFRAELRERRDAIADAQAPARLSKVRGDLTRCQRDADEWTLSADGLDAITGGLAKTYRRARNRMTEAYEEPTPEAFHEWRKRVKYHRYHVRLLRDLFDAPLNARRHALHDLTDDLGAAHDCAELREVLPDLEAASEDPQTARALDAFLAQRWRELNERARPLAERAFVHGEEAFVERFGRLWEVAA